MKKHFPSGFLAVVMSASMVLATTGCSSGNGHENSIPSKFANVETEESLNPAAMGPTGETRYSDLKKGTPAPSDPVSPGSKKNTEESGEKNTEESSEESSEEETESKGEGIPKELEVTISGDHFIGTSLGAEDFHILVKLDNDETLENPEGWWANPLELTGETNEINVGYKDLTTTVTVKATKDPNAPSPSGEGIVPTGGTYSYEQMASDLYNLSVTYPSLVSVNTAGVSADGRDIYFVNFGNAGAGRQIVICAGLRGSDYVMSQMVMKQLEYYCANYETGVYNDRTYRELFDSTCICVIPLANPDGAAVSQQGEAGLRNESLRSRLAGMFDSDTANGFNDYNYSNYLYHWKANANGVDLTRNFPAGWENSVERTAPSSGLYRGAVAGDQSETQSLIYLLNTMSNPLAAVNYQSGVTGVNWQYGKADQAIADLAQKVSSVTGCPLAGIPSSGESSGMNALSCGSPSGDFSGWCIHSRGIPSVTLEMGGSEAPLSSGSLDSLYGANRDLWAALAAE